MYKVFFGFFVFLFVGCAAGQSKSANVSQVSNAAKGEREIANDMVVDNIVNDATPAKVKMLRKACEEAQPSACNILGVLYQDGTPNAVSEDKRASFVYYILACYYNHDVACSNANSVYTQLSNKDQSDFSEENLKAAQKGCANHGNYISCDEIGSTMLDIAFLLAKEGDLNSCYDFVREATKVYAFNCSEERRAKLPEYQSKFCYLRYKQLSRFDCLNVSEDMLLVSP